MALNANMVEQLCTWCLKSASLADAREAARRDFFGCDEPGEVHYEEGAGYPMIRDRRFLGSWRERYGLSRAPTMESAEFASRVHRNFS